MRDPTKPEGIPDTLRIDDVFEHKGAPPSEMVQMQTMIPHFDLQALMFCSLNVVPTWKTPPLLIIQGE